MGKPLSLRNICRFFTSFPELPIVRFLVRLWTSWWFSWAMRAWSWVRSDRRRVWRSLAETPDGEEGEEVPELEVPELPVPEEP